MYYSRLIITLAFCVIFSACGTRSPRENPTASGVSPETIPKQECRKSWSPEFLGDRPILVLTSSKNPVSVGESVELREILFYPFDAKCSTHGIFHTMHAVSIPEEKDQEKYLSLWKFNKELRTAEPVTTRILEPEFSGSIKDDDIGCLNHVTCDHKAVEGWGQDSTRHAEGDVARKIVPGLSSSTRTVRFNIPATYLLGTEWDIRLNNSDAKLRTYILITVTGKQLNPTGAPVLD